MVPERDRLELAMSVYSKNMVPAATTTSFIASTVKAFPSAIKQTPFARWVPEYEPSKMIYQKS